MTLSLILRIYFISGHELHEIHAHDKLLAVPQRCRPSAKIYPLEIVYRLIVVLIIDSEEKTFANLNIL